MHGRVLFWHVNMDWDEYGKIMKKICGSLIRVTGNHRTFAPRNIVKSSVKNGCVSLWGI
jgi:hypothetical protein